ncbi:MAG: YggS family pyridoxal phosphate-dependent enzyme [Pseudomonadota bacterium]
MAETDNSNSAFEDIAGRIATAAGIAERSASDVELVAISKTRSASEIRPLLEKGHRVFGENRVQEAAAKWPELRADYPDVSLHLVGQLQSNKAEDAVALFDVIHSLDRMSLVRALGKAMRKQDRDIPCFIQVNIGEESQKGGCAISETGDLVAAARDAGIPVCGLMCVPPSGVNAAPYFALLAKLAADLDLPGLSMGMSGDFETAVKLGATHIRVGTALFGPRDNTA